MVSTRGGVGGGLKAALRQQQQQRPILTEDVQAALDTQRMHVVLPQWLEECQRLGKRLPEADFLTFPRYVGTSGKLTNLLGFCTAFIHYFCL